MRGLREVTAAGSLAREELETWQKEAVVETLEGLDHLELCQSYYVLALVRKDHNGARRLLGTLICWGALVERISVKDALQEALKAAMRNESKGPWRGGDRDPLYLKLEEELQEYRAEALEGHSWRSREELGDLLWTAIILADHALLLEEVAV